MCINLYILDPSSTFSPNLDIMIVLYTGYGR